MRYSVAFGKYNPDLPETIKFGISVIDYLILVDFILINKKKYFPVQCGIPRYSLNYNPIDLKPINSESELSITVYWFIKYYSIRKNIFPMKCGITRYSVN